MQCCVQFCANESNNVPERISFHPFPRTTWEQNAYFSLMCNKSSELSYVCSQHFHAQDFTEADDGRMLLKHDAVPIMQMCRICLQTDTRLIDMDKYNLKSTYETMLGCHFNCHEYFRNMLCLECVQRLQNCHMFREKSLWSHNLLLDVLRDNKINKESLSVLISERKKLKSTLNVKHYDPNYCDVNLNHEEIEKLDKIEPIEVKYEEKIDFDDIQNDIKHENEDLTPIDDIDFNNDIDNSDYSSDDDLTLKQIEEQKIKKPIKKKKIKQKKDEPETPKVDRRRKPLSIDGVNESLFTVVKMSVERQKEEIVKRQQTLNFKNSPLKCMDCYKGFLDEKAYNTHMIRHSEAYGAFACSICKARFKTHSKVRKHKTAIHSNEYQCNQCNFITTSRQSAKLHEGWHRGKIYKCNQCTDVFIKFTTYMGHLRIKHPSDFVCELCGYAFVSVKGIKLHKKLKHITCEKVPEDGPLCETCNVRFLCEEALTRHLNVSARHKNESQANRQCPNRPPQVSVKSIRRRVKSDDGQDPGYCYQDLTCEQCGMQMPDPRAYHQHFRKMHPDKNRTWYPSMKTPSMCDKCGKIFQSYALLKDHLYSHTNERRFKCPQCDKTFRMKQRLTTHMTTHKQQRYPCHVCGKSFSNLGNRQRHMIIHTGLRPHKCEMCSKTFKTSTEKKTHVNYVHLKKPWPKRSRGRRNRQGQNMQNAASASETEIQTWPPCEKMAINMVGDKPGYYDLKI